MHHHCPSCAHTHNTEKHRSLPIELFMYYHMFPTDGVNSLTGPEMDTTPSFLTYSSRLVALFLQGAAQICVLADHAGHQLVTTSVDSILFSTTAALKRKRRCVWVNSCTTDSASHFSPVASCMFTAVKSHQVAMAVVHDVLLCTITVHRAHTHTQY